MHALRLSFSVVLMSRCPGVSATACPHRTLSIGHCALDTLRASPYRATIHGLSVVYY